MIIRFLHHATRSDRQDRSWLLLALLSLVSAMGTVCDVGGDQRALGFPEGVVVALVGLSQLLLAWPRTC